MTDKNCPKRTNTDGKDPCRIPQEGKLTKLSSPTAHVCSDNLTVCRKSDHYCGFSEDNYFQINSSDMIPFHTQLGGQHEQTSVPEHSVSSTLYKCEAISQHRNTVSPLNSQMSALPGNTEHQDTVSVTPSTPQNTQVNCQMSPWFAMSSTLQTQDQPSDRDNCLPDQVRYKHQSPLSLDSVSMLKQNPKLFSSCNNNQSCPSPVCVKREYQNTQSSVGSCGQGIKRGRPSCPESRRRTDNMSRAASSDVGPFLNNFVNSKSVNDFCWQNLNAMKVYSGITKRNTTLPFSFSHIKTEKVDFCPQKHGNSKVQWQNNHDLCQVVKQESIDTNYSQESIIIQRQNTARTVELMKREQVEPVSSQTSKAVSKSNLETSLSVHQFITTNTSNGGSSSLQEQNSIKTRSLRETCMCLQRGIFQFIPRSVPLSIADAYLLVEKVQCEELGQIPTPRLAVYAYNPLEYAFDVHFQFVQRFCNTEKEILFLGMNPGPWGMSQNGVPFGEARVVRDWMQLSGNVLKPNPENPKRPITGLECTRSEVSGARFWSLFQGLCGTPENFFRTSFVYNMCPLSFMSVTGKNITPPQIEARIRNEMNSICDRALLQVVKLLKVKTIVAVGRYAHDRALGVLKQAGDITVRLEAMMHPSPINPAANQGWEQKVKDQLLAFDLLEILKG